MKDFDDEFFSNSEKDINLIEDILNVTSMKEYKSFCENYSEEDMVRVQDLYLGTGINTLTFFDSLVIVRGDVGYV